VIVKKVPIETLHLFAPLHEKLLELLRSLTAEEWLLPTIARQWNVKDVAAHLLDTSIRYISANRDGHTVFPKPPVSSYTETIAWLNGLNKEWVLAMKRVSPAVLIEWIEAAGKKQHELLQQVDMFAPAPFPVSWAGEETSMNWFHVAREYTERWHHQQQIRDAVNKPGILNNKFYYPVLDTFMRALPYAYRPISAEENTTVQVTISGEGGGDWFITMKQVWQLSTNKPVAVHARIVVDGSLAWKLFTRSWRKGDVVHAISIEGDASLAEPVLEMVTVMA
jgi:uncharacterized protein (TIGR03083 family)